MAVKPINFMPKLLLNPFMGFSLSRLFFSGNRNVSAENRKPITQNKGANSTVNDAHVFWFIDDDPLNNYINSRTLNYHFPKVSSRVFEDAGLAIEKITKPDERLPTVIFLDINMPQINGWEFLDQLSEVSISSHIYILSSSIDPSDHKKAMSYKMVKGFYSKPLEKEMIDAVISSLLAH